MQNLRGRRGNDRVNPASSLPATGNDKSRNRGTDYCTREPLSKYCSLIKWLTKLSSRWKQNRNTTYTGRSEGGWKWVGYPKKTSQTRSIKQIWAKVHRAGPTKDTSTTLASTLLSSFTCHCQTVITSQSSQEFLSQSSSIKFMNREIGKYLFGGRLRLRVELRCHLAYKLLRSITIVRFIFLASNFQYASFHCNPLCNLHFPPISELM